MILSPTALRPDDEPDEIIESIADVLEAEQPEDEQRIRCPHCKWSPNDQSRWVCSSCDYPEFLSNGCGTVWNTFATRGLCPGCGHQWRWTSCLWCHQWSLHEAWYVF